MISKVRNSRLEDIYMTSFINKMTSRCQKTSTANKAHIAEI